MDGWINQMIKQTNKQSINHRFDRHPDTNSYVPQMLSYSGQMFPSDAPLGSCHPEKYHTELKKNNTDKRLISQCPVFGTATVNHQC